MCNIKQLLIIYYVIFVTQGKICILCKLLFNVKIGFLYIKKLSNEQKVLIIKDYNKKNPKAKQNEIVSFLKKNFKKGYKSDSYNLLK